MKTEFCASSDFSIIGFCYTPVQEGNTDGTIFHYNLYQSNDGKEWKGIILNGEFSNIKNNPIPQFVTFGKVLETRYLKLEPIEEINGNQKTVAVNSSLDFFVNSFYSFFISDKTLLGSENRILCFF